MRVCVVVVVVFLCETLISHEEVFSIFSTAFLCLGFVFTFFSLSSLLNSCYKLPSFPAINSLLRSPRLIDC